MNYYPFHLGDYAAHTGHLEPMEDLAYRRLLDLYYLRELPIPADIPAAAKLIRMRSHIGDVEAVLREFFTLTDDGWRHERCDEEIAKMQDKQAKARKSAQASVSARRANAERSLPTEPTDAERPVQLSTTDVELPTPTPTPEEKNTHTPGEALPENWALPKAWGEDAIGEFPHWTPDTVRSVAKQFADHHRAKATMSADWRSSWGKWTRDPLTQKAHPPARPKPTAAPPVDSKTVPMNPAAVASQQADDAERLQRAAEIAAITPEQRAEIARQVRERAGLLKAVA